MIPADKFGMAMMELVRTIQVMMAASQVNAAVREAKEAELRKQVDAASLLHYAELSHATAALQSERRRGEMLEYDLCRERRIREKLAEDRDWAVEGHRREEQRRGIVEEERDASEDRFEKLLVENEYLRQRNGQLRKFYQAADRDYRNEVEAHARNLRNAKEMIESLGAQRSVRSDAFDSYQI